MLFGFAETGPIATTQAAMNHVATQPKTPSLAAAALLADELALHLLLEYLAVNLPGFAETFVRQIDTLAQSENLPATTTSALHRLRDYICAVGGAPLVS